MELDDVRGGYSNTPAQRTIQDITLHKRLKILLDWVGFTVSTEFFDVSTVLKLFEHALEIQPNAWRVGRKNYEGYADSLVFENINIYYNGAENQGIHVDITGQGCRFIETIYQKLGVHKYNWYEFLNLLVGFNADHGEQVIKFTRIDLACDDFHGYINVQDLFIKMLKGEVTSKWKSWEPAGKHDMDGKSKGLTLYLGSEQSRIQGVIYEKNHQLGLSQHWTRIEIRHKHERAEQLIKIFMQNDYTFTKKDTKRKEDLQLNTNVIDTEYSIGMIFAGILKDYITFREPKLSDSNKRRWKVSPFWSEFLEGVEPLRLASALPDRSILKTKGWLDTTVSKGFARCALAFHGIPQFDGWIEKLMDEGYKKFTKEDINQIEEFRRLYANEEKEQKKNTLNN
jgi:phage replication initiation protein